MLNQYIDILRKKFGEALTEKTAFGRNELKLVIEKAMSEAAFEYLASEGNVDALEKPKEEEKVNGQNQPE